MKYLNRFYEAGCDNPPAHKPGETYELTMEQYLRFIGLEELYNHLFYRCFLLARNDDNRINETRIKAFWAAIASFASEHFGADCGSLHGPAKCHLQITTAGTAEWLYTNNTGLYLRVVQHTKQNISFFVAIPAEQDQPGGTYYEELHNGQACSLD